MNSRERVLAALRREQPDRVPFVEGGIDPPMQRALMGRDRFLPEELNDLIGLDNLESLIAVCLRHPAAANQVFLAGDAEALSTTELLRRTARALGVRARLIPVPVPLLAGAAALLRRRDVVQRLCGDLDIDTSKAQRLLGWRPPVTIDEGLRRAAAPLAPARVRP